MAISRKEMTMLALFGVGLLVLRDRNWDINNDGSKNDTDKGLILLLGAGVVFFLMN